MRKTDQAGFTLAELLIVVAIVAALVAISLPIFMRQLERSRESVDMSNIRSAYAECSAALHAGAGDPSSGIEFSDESYPCTASKKDIEVKQGVEGWITEGSIGGKLYGGDSTDIPSVKVGDKLTVTVKEDGTWECIKQ